MSRYQFIVAALLLPLAFFGCSDDTDPELVLDPAPTIVLVAPDNPAVTETVLVTITGTNFQPGAAAFLNDVPADLETVVSATVITALLPAPGVAPTYTLMVRNPDGQEATIAMNYAGPPLVTQVSPYGGPLAGGTAVTLTGTGFQTGAIVLVDGIPATSVATVSGTSTTCTTPATASAAQLLAEISVQNPDNQIGTLLDVSNASAEMRGFLYSPAPTVTTVLNAGTTNTGPQAGGTAVTITGTGFHRTIALGGEADTDATVTFDGTAATNVTVVSDTSITCDTPAHAFGDVDVVVTNPDTQFGTGAAAFHYNEFPVINNVTPSSVGLGGGTTVTIDGTFFMESAANPPTVMVGPN
ncbi:MAG: IPT/TIG domain-containing protein, partial [Planctomycetota bacterium]